MHARASALLLLACALTAIIGAPLAAGAVSKAPMTAQVTPAGGLGDQVVQVSWEHFQPTRADGTFSVVIMQCSADPKSVLADCNTDETFPLSLTGNQALGNTQSNGKGSAFVDVETTARLPSLACAESHPCSLLLFEQTLDGYDPNGLPPDRVIVPLHFRKTAADCPPVTHFDVRTEAESSAAAALYQWAGEVCTGPGAFTVDVTNTSSNAARQEFFDGNVDMGATSLPPEPGEVPADAPAYTVTPLDLTGVAIAYNIVDPVTQQRITDLTLTPRLIARLVSDTDVLTFFDDPQFKKLNPHHHFPQTASDPGVRAEQNADTWLVTNWLNSNSDARNFLNGQDRYGVKVNPAWQGVKYPTDVFEARNPNGAYLPRTGEDAIGQRLFYETKPADSVASSPSDVGFIGIVDLPTARRYNLPVARLTTGVGAPRVGPDAAAIQAGYRDMTVTKKGFHVMPAVPTNPQAYPLTKVDHALTLTDVPNALTAARIKYLLGYAAGIGQTTLPPGFVPFPGPLQPPTTTTTSTTTTTASTTTTTTLQQSSGPGSSQSPFATPPDAAGTPNAAAAAAVKVARTQVRGSSAPKVVTPRLQLISQDDGMALPIVVVLGLLAAAYLLADVTRRRGPALVANARRWRAGRAGAGPPGARS